MKVHPPALVAARLAFEARGVMVRPPASDDLLAWLEQTFGRGNVSSLVALYRVFDGFERFDNDTFILIWPLERVRRIWLASERRHLEFADAALDAIIYAALRSRSDQRVYDIDTDDYLALDAVHFVENMISRRLNF